MIQKNKKIVLIATGIAIAVIIIFLLIIKIVVANTVKSDENLFITYFAQNFEMLDNILDTQNISNINETTLNSKYKSEVRGKITYTENVNTSNESRNSAINKIGLKIVSNIDNANEYSYRDISLGTDQEDYVRFEILKESDKIGLRQNGIQQFISGSVSQKDIMDYSIVNTYSNIENIMEQVSKSSLSFSDTEKQTLINTYSQIIKENVEKEKYQKQSNILITVNNEDVKTDEYYVKLTSKEYNNLLTKILEKVSEDEIILSKVDLFEDKISQIYNAEEETKNSRESFKEIINDLIKKINESEEDNGETRISVFVSDKKLVRTTIEKNMNKTIIDINSNTSIIVDSIQYGDVNGETKIKIDMSNGRPVIQYTKLQNDNIINEINMNYQEQINNESIYARLQIKLANEKNECLIDFSDNIQIVNQFEKQLTLKEDNVELNSLTKEQKTIIDGILTQNMEEQLKSLYGVVTLEDYANMINKVTIGNNGKIYLLDDSETVTELEKRRFNSQFEFFGSSNLTTENMKELLKTVENNLSDIKVILKNGDITELELDILNSNSNEELKEYLNNVSDILFVIKENQNNNEKIESFTKFLNDNNNYKYDVSIEYDSSGLVRAVKAKIKSE